MILLFFFFKQKTAYEMRISDWSSDVCSSDLIGEEPRAAYDRVHLTEFFSGKSADDLALARPDFAEAYGIGLQLNTRATAIDREDRTVTTATGEVVPYDRSEEHTSELQSLMSISYAVFCLKKQNNKFKPNNTTYNNITTKHN